MIKSLILIRHGHRDNSSREVDNGLDEKGKEQAKAIKRFFGTRFSPGEIERGLWIASSPKLRCVQTLEPLAKGLGRVVDIHPGLDEQGAREAGSAFEKRIQLFLHEWRQTKAAITVISSHGDWLPVAARILIGASLDPKKGSWLEVEGLAEQPSLKWYIGSFKHFYS